MDTLDSLLIKLKSGTRQEKGGALTELARLKNPRAFDALREVMATSDDAELSLMACCALAMSGDSEAAEAMKAMFSLDKSSVHEMLSVAKDIGAEPDSFKSFDLFNLAKEFEEANQTIYRAHPREAKEKLQRLLSVFNKCRESNELSSKTSFLDGMVEFTSKRTSGLILSSLGLVELRLGNIDESFNCGEKALAIGNEIQDGQVLSTALGNIGIAYMEMDKYYDALDCFSKSLEAMENYTDPWRKKNRVLYNMSLLYCKIGDMDNSRKFAKDALEEARKEMDDLGTGWCLNANGIVSLNLNGGSKAEAYFLEALENCKKTGDRQTEGSALINLGYINYERKDYKIAEEFLCRALKIFEDTGNKSTTATVYVNLAYLYLDQADIAKARECALEALRLAEDTVSIRDDADACYILGSIDHFCYQDYESAYDYYRKAIELYEKIRKNLAADNLKIAFSENSASCYAQMVGLCIDIGRANEALEYVERSKSRALVELLSKTLDEISPREVPAERIDKVRRLKDTLAALEKELRSLYKCSRNIGNVDDERSVRFLESDELYPRFILIERKYKEVYEELKRLDPELASFAAVEPVKIDEIKNLFEKETCFIEYYLTPERIYIFVISPEAEINVRQVEIDINEESDRLLLLFDSLRGSMVSDTASHDFYKEIKSPLAGLYDLLIEPIEELIKNAKRLVIAPHLLLHYLPFHALYDKGSGGYIIDRFEIVYTPSAEVLKYCRKKNDTTRKSAVIFANPTDDLPYAEEEARKIAECFKPNDKLYIGAEATHKNLDALGDVDIIHIACHGIYRSDEPIFSHLLLADTEEGRGACYLPDIFNLKLKTPTLVTLSACESGLSKFTSGDELIGVARGFFYAGAPSIIASLWHVNDKSTSIFMEVFYRNLRNMIPKSKALQLAIQELKSRFEYRHPYFWAPFVLLGDWI